MFLLFFFLLRGGQELCPVPNHQLRFLLCLFMESQFQNLLKPVKSISIHLYPEHTELYHCDHREIK